MQILGLSITRTKSLPPTLSNIDNRGGWWPIIREAFAGAWQSNVTVELANVLTYSPVYACLRLISSDIGKLPVRLMQQNDETGIWTETESAAFSPFLRRPNRYQTRIKFFQYWVVSKLIHGNTYVLKERDNRGVVRAGYILDPTRVKTLVAPDGSIYYELQADNISSLQTAITVPADEIMHDMHVMFYHPLNGVSPLSACGVPAVEALRIQDQSAVFFGNGSKPGGVLTAPGHIAQDTAERIKAFWDANFTGSNAGKVAVLGDNLKYEQMAVNAQNSQLIEQLKWTAEDVCQAFGVPPYKINVGPPPNYNNIQALDIQYYSQCLQELIESIEDCLDIGLGLAPDKVNGVRLGVEFDRKELLQMDTAGRMDAATKAINSGLSPNEVRARYHDVGPVPGGNIPFMQQQNWPIEQLAMRKGPPSDQSTPPSQSPSINPQDMPDQTPAPSETPQPDTTRALDPTFEKLQAGYLTQAIRLALARLPA
jgi:HK97 family phage portal protein